MPQPPFATLEEEGGAGGGGGGAAAAAAAALTAGGAAGQGGKRPVDINQMKRNMTIAKGFLDISLLSANANQLSNVVSYGNKESGTHYLILSGIVISIIMQVTAGVLLILAERFDINKEDEQHQGNTLNTVVTCLIFSVLIINVFVACLGVDVKPKDPYPYPGQGPYPYPAPGQGPYPSDPKGVYNNPIGGYSG